MEVESKQQILWQLLPAVRGHQHGRRRTSITFLLCVNVSFQNNFPHLNAVINVNESKVPHFDANMFKVIGGRSVQAARLLAPRSAVLVEPVRGRKSRNDPVAKSKEGRIKVPPPVDPVEMVVLKERFSEYQLILRALR